MIELLCGAIALAGLVLTVGALLRLHIVPTGLSPLRNPVSQYGIGDYRIGYRAAAISLGATAATLATGIGEFAGDTGSGLSLGCWSCSPLHVW